MTSQFLRDNVIVLFEFAQDDSGVGIACEKHYKLVPPEDVTESYLAQYRALAGR